MRVAHATSSAKDVRKYLRRRHGISGRREPTGVLAVWSVEKPRDDARRCPATRTASRGAPPRARSGAAAPKVFGSAAFVTGAFGLAAAAAVVQRLSGVARAAPRQRDSGSAAPQATARPLIERDVRARREDGRASSRADRARPSRTPAPPGSAFALTVAAAPLESPRARRRARYLHAPSKEIAPWPRRPSTPS